jgi:hypothetical protein
MIWMQIIFFTDSEDGMLDHDPRFQLGEWPPLR